MCNTYMLQKFQACKTRTAAIWHMDYSTYRNQYPTRGINPSNKSNGIINVLKSAVLGETRKFTCTIRSRFCANYRIKIISVH